MIVADRDLAKTHPRAAGAPSPRDEIIDGWRGLACLAVMLGHAIAFRYGELIPAARMRPDADYSTIALGILNRLGACAASLGVTFFFVISGYIITTLLLKEEERRGTVSLRAFYIRRAFRIIPAFALFLAALALVNAAGYIAIPWRALAYSGAFLCDTSFVDCTWFAAHTWSLAVEEQYYLAWPLLFILLRGRRTYLLMGVVIGSVLAVIAGAGFRSVIAFGCIALGAALACNPHYIARIRRSGRGPLLIGAAAVLFATPFTGTHEFAFRLLSAATPFLVTYIIFASYGYSALARVLRSRPVQIVGLLSYSFYLWQQLFLGEPRLYEDMAPPTLLMLPLIAGLSFYLERKFIRLGHRISARQQSRGSTGAALQQARVSGPVTRQRIQ